MVFKMMLGEFESNNKAGGEPMKFSYNKLWKLMIDKGLKLRSKEDMTAP
jgi:hypothetical protein